MSATAPPRGSLPDGVSVLDDARRMYARGQVRQVLALVLPLLPSPTTSTLDAAPVDHVGHVGHVGHVDMVELRALALQCHLAQGDLAAARSMADALAGTTAPQHLPLALHARAELASALDAPETAAELFLAAGAAGGDQVVPLLPWRAGAALALVRTGRRREGLEIAHAHLALVQVSGTGQDVAMALRTLATVESDGLGVQRLRQAADLLSFGEADRLKAQIDTDLAGLLLLGGVHDEAVALLRAAEAFASRQDLWPLQGRVRRLLERLGETPRRMEAEALAALTAAERRVALLALDGLSNRDIAEHLHVSVKAVEGHLSKVYRKLGVPSRAALQTIVSRRD